MTELTSRHGLDVFFHNARLYPTCIQTQHTVEATSSCLKISNHIAQHRTINIGRIHSN
jgi:hypothetical protein